MKVARTVWLTYAWADNTTGDVDYFAQQLESAGLAVKVDRTAVVAGRRLWDQIATQITNKDQCDAWLWYLTEQSLASEPCREEYAYALDRALRARGEAFPLIPLVSTNPGTELPPGVRTRLYVSLRDGDWVQQVIDAVHGRASTNSRSTVVPIDCRMHAWQAGTVLELRPRAGTWGPCTVGVPVSDIMACKAPSSVGGVASVLAPRGTIPMLKMSGQTTTSSDGQYVLQQPGGEATPTMSLYVFFSQLPSHLIVGRLQNGGPLYRLEFDGNGAVITQIG